MNDSNSIYQASSPVKETQNLTTFAEVAPQAMGQAGQADKLGFMANPYLSPDLKAVLTRQYKIADIEWQEGGTDPYGTSLGTVDLMKLLVEVRNISDKLTQFRWIRSDIEVEVRLNATPFHIGSVVMSHLPRTVADVSNALTMWRQKTASVAQKTQNSAMILSASSMNNLTFIVKREAATLMDPIDEAGSYDGCLGTLDFTVLNPLSLASDGTVAPVNIAVFARFINPEPSGLGYFPILGALARVRPQSGTVATEALSRAAGAIVGPEASKLFDTVVTSSPVQAITSAIESIAPAAQFAMSLGLSKPPNQTTVTPALIDDFRDLNYAHGVSNATKFALHPGAGLGTPNMNQLKKNPLREFISRPSLITTVTFTKESDVDVPLLTLPVHPSLCNFEVLATNPTFTPTPLAYASQAFTWWRGGMKFFFQFVTSQFVTARFRITHWPSPTFPSSIEAFAGDAVSMVVDVRGDTPVTFDARYISPYPYQNTRGYIHSNNEAGWNQLPVEEQNSFITISLINLLQQPDATGSAKIYLNVYAAASEDFIFGGAVSAKVRTPLSVTPTVRVRPQSLITTFAKPFSSIVPSSSAYEAGLVLPEQYSTVEELTMRYDHVEATPAFSGLVTQYDNRDNTLTACEDIIEFFAVCYRWNRGGIRWKVFFTPDELPDSKRYCYFIRILIENNSTGGSDFTMVLDNRLRSTVEAEIPWVLNTHSVSYWNCIAADRLANKEPYIYQVTDDTGTVLTPLGRWRSVADDFMFGHQLAMPVLVYDLPTPPSAEKAEARRAIMRVKADHPPTSPQLDQSWALPKEVREKLTTYLLKKEKESTAGH